MREPTMSEVLQTIGTLTRITSTWLRETDETKRFPGAIGTEDVLGQLIETKRQLTTYGRWRWGDQAFDVLEAYEETIHSGA